ncbi:hypothetical protein [Sphingobium sp. TCM1]|uniref:hypothetical protein n=1 Tax=Sphingobium sp. TCM1 TaxID=453246 RepID=UPI000A5EAA6B|nr:hypothetical protein [Sphingobium sp. TCM1]
MADRLRILWVAAGLLLLVFVPAYLLTLTAGQGIPRDGTSLVVGRDFLNIWMYGRAAWEAHPEVYYDMDTYRAALGRVVGGGYPGQIWSYPPVALLAPRPSACCPTCPRSRSGRCAELSPSLSRYGSGARKGGSSCCCWPRRPR